LPGQRPHGAGMVLFPILLQKTFMEPTFLNVMMFVIPALTAAFFLIKRTDDHEEKIVGHKMYRNYRKSRMDKPVV
jgi:hypothetical protein